MPRQEWIADLTDRRSWQGWLYLPARQTAYSRRIVSSAMAYHMRAELVVDALQMAAKPAAPPIAAAHWLL
jgi:putative transposase